MKNSNEKMKKNTEAADEYRNERKDRLSKQTKNSGKKHNSHAGLKNVLSKVAAAVVSVVVVVAILFASLNFFGVPQRVLKAVVIDGESYSMSELSIYYMLAYRSVSSYASQIESTYGSGNGKLYTGYDVSLPPDEQTTKDDDGNVITWSDYFMEEAIEDMATVKRYYAKASEAGIKISEEEQAEIDETIESFKSSANGYSLSRFISKNYGKGVDEKLMRKVLTERAYVSLYQETRKTELKGTYGDDAVNAEYEKDPTEYDVVDFRWYHIDVKSSTAEKTSEAATGEDETSGGAATVAEVLQAQAFIDKVASQPNYDAETFRQAILDDADPKAKEYDDYKNDRGILLKKITKSAIKSNISEDASSWMYEKDDNGNYVRQTGDMNKFLSSDGKTVYIIFMTGIPYQNDTKAASVRHILVKFPETTKEAVSGEETIGTEEKATVSESVKAECSSKADAILAEYESYINENENGKADEDYFAELASKKTEDSGSAKDGGLMADMENNGQYVPEFEDWAFAQGAYEGEERTPGKTGIIETEYGYHVMYYVGNHEQPSWYETVQNKLVDDAWNEEDKKFTENFGEDAIKRREFIVNRVKKASLKLIKGY